MTEGSSLPTAPNGRKDIYTDLELPGILTFSGIYEASPEVSLMANLEWTKWSTLKEVVIRNSSDGSISDKEEFDYSNVWFFSVGAKYKYNDVTTLKLGFAFDNTPSKNEHRSPRLPDEDKWWLSVGLSYAFSENVHSSLDYTYVGVNRPNINLKVTSPNGALIRELKGHFDANVHIVGAKLAYQI